MCRRPQILLLDDEVAFGHACALMLKQQGDVHHFSVVESALGFAERSQVDLAIVDIAIGRDTEAGLRVIQTVAARMGPTLPIIAVSGHNNDQLGMRCLDAGAYDFVSKPFHPPEFRARVQRHLATGAALANAGVMSAQPAAEGLPFEFAGASIAPVEGLIQFPDGSQPERLMQKYALILRLLASSIGTVVTREAFARKVWGSDGDKDSRSINVYLSTVTQIYKKHGIDLRQWLDHRHGAGWLVSRPKDSHGLAPRSA